ncbi:39S ribosomal protein L17, mitochondrial [Frankliniella fusca]|uniref:Large ribosomal subunit protein bL17m n=1 Tax=Frankliniella fusca TaxID=407009 RepID=A0AAE1GRJ3_9NEOP|nr:39S ribosomal protein L17, mitochondrial [Frankliniella fusca]
MRMNNKPVPLRPLIHYADLSKLVSRLKIPVHWHVKKLRGGEIPGPEGRLLKLRKSVTALIKYERIEMDYYPAEEARGYAERLISEAVRHGPQCPETMEMADWWLEEKQLIHKLFKVLVPRYQHYPSSFTNFYRAPFWYFSDGFQSQLNEKYPDREINETIPAFRTVSYPKGLLELKGNPYPPIFRTNVTNPRSIQNVLLSSAKDFFKSQPPKDTKDSKAEVSNAENSSNTDFVPVEPNSEGNVKEFSK